MRKRFLLASVVSWGATLMVFSAVGDTGKTSPADLRIRTRVMVFRAPAKLAFEWGLMGLPSPNSDKTKWGGKSSRMDAKEAAALVSETLEAGGEIVYAASVIAASGQEIEARRVGEITDLDDDLESRATDDDSNDTENAENNSTGYGHAFTVTADYAERTDAVQLNVRLELSGVIGDEREGVSSDILFVKCLMSLRNGQSALLGGVMGSVTSDRSFLFALITAETPGFRPAVSPEGKQAPLAKIGSLRVSVPLKVALSKGLLGFVGDGSGVSGTMTAAAAAKLVAELSRDGGAEIVSAAVVVGESDKDCDIRETKTVALEGAPDPFVVGCRLSVTPRISKDGQTVSVAPEDCDSSLFLGERKVIDLVSTSYRGNIVMPRDGTVIFSSFTRFSGLLKETLAGESELFRLYGEGVILDIYSASIDE